MGAMKIVVVCITLRFPVRVRAPQPRVNHPSLHSFLDGTKKLIPFRALPLTPNFPGKLPGRKFGDPEEMHDWSMVATTHRMQTQQNIKIVTDFSFCPRRFCFNYQASGVAG